jgi:iron complex transport system substrate-binding protein
LDIYHVASRSLPLIVALAAVTLLATGCGERSEPTGDIPAPYPVTVQGAGEAPTALSAQPRRIVALDAGSAELVDALGAGDRLVGVPADAVLRGGEKPAQIVKATGQIDAAAVAELEPDLIVATPDTDRVDVSQVERRTGAPLYLQPSRSVDDVLRAVIELGWLVGQPVEARQLATALRTKLAALEQRLAGERPVPVFVDRGFFITVSDDSLLGDLIRLARGENIAAGNAGLGPFPIADLVAKDPDVYLATSDAGVTLESLRRNEKTRALPAVRAGRVVVVPADLVTHAGPRVAEALQAVAVALHPDAFR